MESVKPRFAVEAHLAEPVCSRTGRTRRGGRSRGATQDEPASSEPRPQEVMAAPVELPSARSAEQRAVLTEQNEERHDWM